MTRNILTALLSCCFFLAIGQFEKDYEPIKFTSKIPADFIQNIHQKTLDEIKNRAKDDFSKKEGIEFYTLTNYAVSKAFRSGNVYFNDELTAYIRDITDKVLIADPDLRKEVKIHLTKFTIPNAFAWRTGTIFINIGMLAHLENEAQLAFIIAHESAHIAKRHSIKKYKKQQESQQRPLFSGEENVDDFFELMRFSRTQELQADEYGLELYLKSEYDPKEAIRALEILKTVDEESNKERLDLIALMQIDTLVVSTPMDCFAVEQDSTDSDYELEDDFSEDVAIDTLSVKEDTLIIEPTTENIEEIEEENSEESEEEEEDLNSTHPSIKKRIEQVKTLMGSEKGGAKMLVNEAQFHKMITQVHFEMIEKYYREGDYVRCFYEILILQRKYPDNQFLLARAAACTYWITYYRSIGSLDNILESYYSYFEEPFGYFLCDLDTWDKEEWIIIGNQYLKDLHKKSKDNEWINSYLLKVKALNEEDKPTKEEYEKFIDAFPNSPHSIYFQTIVNKQ